VNDQYKKHYTDQSFQNKLKRFAKAAGLKVTYAALLLYYLMKDPNVPIKAKLSISAALGYFILPTDAIPDIAPLIGFSDDLGVLIFCLSQIAGYITPEIREKAKQQLIKWFKPADLKEIDQFQF